MPQCDCVMQLWVMCLFDMPLCDCDSVVSHMGLYWFDYVTPWCSSSQRPTLESPVAQWLEHPKSTKMLFLIKTRFGCCKIANKIKGLKIWTGLFYRSHSIIHKYRSLLYWAQLFKGVIRQILGKREVWFEFNYYPETFFKIFPPL